MRRKLLRWRWWYVPLILALCVGALWIAFHRSYPDRPICEWPAGELWPTKAGFLCITDSSVTLRDWTTGASTWALDDLVLHAVDALNIPYPLCSWSPSGEKFAVLDETANAVDIWTKGVPDGHIPLPAPMRVGETITRVLDDGRCIVLRRNDRVNDVFILSGGRVAARGSYTTADTGSNGAINRDMAVAPDGAGVLLDHSTTYLTLTVSGKRVTLTPRDHPDSGGISGDGVSLYPGGVWYDVNGAIAGPGGITRAGGATPHHPAPGSAYIAELVAPNIRVLNPTTGDNWSIAMPTGNTIARPEWITPCIETSIDGNALAVQCQPQVRPSRWPRWWPRWSRPGPAVQPPTTLMVYLRPGTVTHQMRFDRINGTVLPAPDAYGVVVNVKKQDTWVTRLYRW
jgi:hypothetical protein